VDDVGGDHVGHRHSGAGLCADAGRHRPDKPLEAPRKSVPVEKPGAGMGGLGGLPASPAPTPCNHFAGFEFRQVRKFCRRTSPTA
jgi:hypothetical protein